ncbi:ferredoxin-type protein NapF [Microbulbifer sp. S227A]|uniref:ferredoxin-type protein NapF n=1 Tax=Microbulbifer sp. S227A TaxID=3415131 RepID=UPI003C7B6E32
MPANASNTLTRRDFLRNPGARPAPEFRPPWSDEAAVRRHCTGCGDCVRACPQEILELDDNRHVRVALHGRDCTFCAACATACDEDVFDVDQSPPWPVVAEITGRCLLAAGIACQLCTDICEPRALRLDASVRPMGRLRLDTTACTGCGACLGLCPNDAITLTDPRMKGPPE